MAQPEARLSREILMALRLKGYFAFKVHGGPTMMAGLPDIVCCAEGLFFGIETKMPAKRSNVSVRQKFIHEQINNASGYAMVVCSANEALRKIQEQIERVFEVIPPDEELDSRTS